MVDAQRQRLMEAREFHAAQVESAREDDDVSFVMSRRSERLLEEIDLALEAIEDGSYGYCVSCSLPIPIERLEAVPHTRHCTACASRG
jgi:RNA polymerase-binding protein DksA